ncbi:glycosyltransferase family 2 protein [Pedobacter mendelii]|uniref:Glycosyl transferase n=1 Tax=Pedobacter mendelii TaxID=1908240 RepID=A0ABQ2BPK8_9SPHI|nr:glycosyltransferase family 2 protein [Pedobacter mendelii]GGI29277.1 glycosyl transferase [Pedobacter mendelii]
MKISIITVVYNGKAYIKDCIESIINQSHKDIEYIIIDGNSTDGTLLIIEEYQQYLHHFISEKDNGLYDAINKGICLATGEIVGVLNADDVFANENVVEEIVNSFKQNPEIEGVYGDLNYIHPVHLNIIRKWKSKPITLEDIKLGWMPAHPTLYLKRNLFEKYGNYALDLGTAADYDLILRFFFTHKLNVKYLPVLMVKMRTGGVSNNSFNSLFNALVNDYKALKKNAIPNPLLVIIRKKLSKIKQFW